MVLFHQSNIAIYFHFYKYFQIIRHLLHLKLIFKKALNNFYIAIFNDDFIVIMKLMRAVLYEMPADEYKSFLQSLFVVIKKFCR